MVRRVLQVAQHRKDRNPAPPRAGLREWGHWGSLRSGPLAGEVVGYAQLRPEAAPASLLACPPHGLLLPSCCLSSGVHWLRLPTYLRSLLFSCCGSCVLCLVTACPSSVLLGPWCVQIAFLPCLLCPVLSSSCPSLIFLLSCWRELLQLQCW